MFLSHWQLLAQPWLTDSSAHSKLRILSFWAYGDLLKRSRLSCHLHSFRVWLLCFGFFVSSAAQTLQYCSSLFHSGSKSQLISWNKYTVVELLILFVWTISIWNTMSLHTCAIIHLCVNWETSNFFSLSPVAVFQTRSPKSSFISACCPWPWHQSWSMHDPPALAGAVAVH